MLNSNQINAVLKRLDEVLLDQGIDPVVLRVCGGGALLVLGIVSRQTRDLDVVTPKLTEELITGSRKVAVEFSLPLDWLNNGPENLVKDLNLGWEDRCQLIYSGRNLRIFALGREDLIASKIYAYCDREESDLEDLLKIKPTHDELNALYQWLLERDASVHWPTRVESKWTKLLKRLGYEK
jgi:hypothetical protein